MLLCTDGHAPLPRGDVSARARRPSSRAGLALVGVLLTFASFACDRDSQPAVTDNSRLLDATTCQGCHPNHVDQWSASMHAYASDDPVFMAMNKRGQRETNGALGDFCVKCHAPVALQAGLTKDGLNLDQVARPYKGVNCYFCHSIESVQGTHDNPLVLAKDGAMLGPITDPVTTSFHNSRYSPNLDSGRTESSTACGSCHDIVNGKGTHIERTFAEFQGSLYAAQQNGLGCGGCHINSSDGEAALGTGHTRKVHDHGFPGVDTALTAWPGKDVQQKAIDDLLATSLQPAICYDQFNARIAVIIDNVGAGHMIPSGASSDRRLWVEVVASAKDQVIYQSGVVPDGQSVESLTDPDLWLIRDCFFDEANKPVHMFWQAARFTTNLVPVSILPTVAMPVSPGHLRWDYPSGGTAKLSAVPDKITVRLRMQAVGKEVLDDLVGSGDLDAALATQVKTFDVPNGTLTWTMDSVNAIPTDRGGQLLCYSPVPVRAGTNLAATQAKCDPAGPVAAVVPAR